MIIYWNRNSDEMVMRESDDFHRFSLLCSGPRPDIAPAGPPYDVRFETPDVVWIPVTSIITAHGNAGDGQWLSNMYAMIEKAAEFGWVSEDGRDVRAHVTWEAEQKS